MADDITALQGRLQRLEDLQEIQQLCLAYGRLLDQRDFHAYAQLFAEDGEILLGPVARARGRAEIEATMARALGPAGPTSGVHIIGIPVVQLDGDTATAETQWASAGLGADGDKAVLGMIGRHVDELVREDGRWRFKRRRGFVDIPSAVPASVPRAG